MTLQPGQRITTSFLATPAEVKAFAERDGYYHPAVEKPQLYSRLFRRYDGPTLT